MTIAIFALVLLLFAGGAFLFTQRMRKVRALEAQLSSLSGRTQRPVAELLAPRQRQINRSIIQAIAHLRDRSVPMDEVEKQLPRFQQQIARLEQDALVHQEAAGAQKKLIDWVMKLEGQPIESELFELRAVAQNALRITTALIEEGDLPQARDTAVHADTLLTRQNETLQVTIQRLREVKARIDPLFQEAEEANAAILVRGPWTRTLETQAELERLDLSGRVSDALIAATRLHGDLHSLVQDLKVQLQKQADEKKGLAATALAEMLMWPPDSETERRRVRGLLETLETPRARERTSPRTLTEVREVLEQAQAVVDASKELGALHRKHWQVYVTELTRRLRQSSLKDLASAGSLPADLVTEAVAVGKLRTRVEPRLGSVPGWQVADEVLEILERERKLLEQVDELVQALTGRVQKLGEGLATFRRVTQSAGLEPARLALLETDHQRIRDRLERRDYDGLEAQLEKFDSDLDRELEQARAQCIESARISLATMEQVVSALRLENLTSLAGDHGRELERDLAALRRELEAQEVLGALRAAGDWNRAAPNLLSQVRQRRYEQWGMEKEGLESDIREALDQFPRAGVQKALRRQLEVLEQRARAAATISSAPAALDDLHLELERIQAQAAQQRERVQAAYRELSGKAQPGAELAGLVPESQERVRAELGKIVGRLLELEPDLEVSDGVEEELRAVGEDLNWILLRARKELAQRFLSSYKAHQAMLERLTRSTVQFYLPEQAGEAIQEARRLAVECNPFLSQESGQVELTDRLLVQLADLEKLWRDALPRARRFYEKQLGMLEIELNAIDQTAAILAGSSEASLPGEGVPGAAIAVLGGVLPAGGLPVSLQEQLAGMRAEIASIQNGLQSEGWEAAILAIDDLAVKVRAASDRAAQFRRLCRWADGQRMAIQQQVQQLGAVGCHAEAKQLDQALAAWDLAVARGAAVDELETRKGDILQRQEQAGSKLRQAVEEVEKSLREQKEVERFREVLGQRKQDLDWLRSCLKDVLAAGPDGLNLREGLGSVQGLQRALDAISLDLEAARAQDAKFQAWVKGVRERAEARFNEEFDEVIDSLHDRPPSMKALAAEVLAHIDSVLSSGQAEAGEAKRYQALQKRGDAYHKLFGKKFSV